MSEFSNPGWVAKFRNAFYGIAKGVREQNSFYVHIPIALTAILLSILVQVEWIELTIVILCIGVVLACELLNSALEKLAKCITKEFDKHIRDALDIASGAVLIASLMAVAAGSAILFPACCRFFGF